MPTKKSQDAKTPNSAVILAPFGVPKMPFRLNAKGLFLTYAQCDTSREDALANAQRLLNTDDNKIVTYIVAQERHQDGEFHLHCWFGMQSKVNFKDVNKLDVIGGKHGNYQAARSPKNVMQYCIKEDQNWLANFDVVRKIAAMTSKKKYVGTELITNKRKLHDLVQEDPSLIYDYSKLKRAMSEYHNDLNAPTSGEFRNVEVIVLWGAPGTGKSRTANSEGAYSMASTSPEWWNGYNNHDVIHIEDFNGEIPYTRLLRILDGYKIMLPIKGGFVWSLYTKVYITSNTSPYLWYPNNDFAALGRRINEIRELKAGAPAAL